MSPYRNFLESENARLKAELERVIEERDALHKERDMLCVGSLRTALKG